MTSAALASAVQMPTKRSASVPIELEKLSTTPKTLVVDDTDDTVVAAINDGCCAAVRNATAHEPAIWILFIDYFLSSWSDRMWAFALPVLFVEKLQSQAGSEDDSSTSLLLLPASLYALLSQVACVFFGSAIGAWIDRENRRRVVAILLAVQNGCVVAAAFLFAYITRDDDNAPGVARVVGILGAVRAAHAAGRDRRVGVARAVGGDQEGLGRGVGASRNDATRHHQCGHARHRSGV
jgi:hypothetical protein